MTIGVAKVASMSTVCLVTDCGAATCVHCVCVSCVCCVTHVAAIKYDTNEITITALAGPDVGLDGEIQTI